MNRVKSFLIARTNAGLTTKEIAQQLNISRDVLVRVISGKTKSRRILSAVDFFIEKEFEKMCVKFPKRKGGV